jgi:hypothetical protein
MVWRVLSLWMEERPPICRVAANILNKQSRTANKESSSSLWLGRGYNNSSHLNRIFVTKYHRQSFKHTYIHTHTHINKRGKILIIIWLEHNGDILSKNIHLYVHTKKKQQRQKKWFMLVQSNRVAEILSGFLHKTRRYWGLSVRPHV